MEKNGMDLVNLAKYYTFLWSSSNSGISTTKTNLMSLESI